MRITIVDEEMLLCEVLRDALRETFGATVACLPKTGTRIDEVAATRPDLVIVDVWVIAGEEARGWALIQRARQHATLRRVPILIMTADPKGLRDYSADIDAVAPARVLLKPFPLDALEVAVQEMLGIGEHPVLGAKARTEADAGTAG